MSAERGNEAELVELTLPEFGQAVQTAWLRMAVSAAHGFDNASTYRRSMLERLDQEVVGACGEIAVGKLVDRWYVPSVNAFHVIPDCLEDVEVRSTKHRDGCLIVRDNDAPDRRYVLAVMDGNAVRLVGWILGSEARRAEWKRDPHGHRPAWFVPQLELRGMCELDH